MSLVVNTNVSSLTAQRALAFADQLQGEAMERLSTGKKINSASDDAAGLAIAQRMSSQVNGLNMAVKNANDGISLTQSVEGALVEVADMLQRLRQLSVQAANDTNTNTDRTAIQEEVNLLIAEISRVSANTRFNGQKVLDGSFLNKQLQVGTEAGEAIGVSIDSTSASQLGAYEIVGDRIAAKVGAGNGIYENQTDDPDDVIINGNSVSKTIAVSALDSSKNVAANINNVSGETGVTAEAKTYAWLHSEFKEDQTYSLKINNTTTGDFVLNNTNVADALDKINAISGTTGVTATATSDNKIRLYAEDGSDMLIENEKALTNLRVKTVNHDGITAEKSLATHAVKGELEADVDTIVKTSARSSATGVMTIASDSTAGGSIDAGVFTATRAGYVTITQAAGDDSLNHVTIIGKDDKGTTITENVQLGAAAGTLKSTKVYAEVSSLITYVTSSGAAVQSTAALSSGIEFNLRDSTDYFIQNKSTGVNTSFATTTTHSAEEYMTLMNNALNTTAGTAGIKVTSADATSITTGNVYLTHKPTGDVYKMLVSGYTAASWQTAISGATLEGGDLHGTSRSLANQLTASLTGGKVQLVGSRNFGDFELHSDAALTTSMVDQGHTNHKVGIEGNGIEVEMKVKQPDGGAVSYIAADADALKTASALTSTYGINGAAAFTTASNLSTAGGSVYSATRGHILNYAQKVTYTSAGGDTGLLITVLGENIDGSIISETIEGTAANSEVSTLNNFKAIKTITFSKTNTGTSSTLGLSGYTTEFAYHGARTFGDFEISHSATGTSLLDGQTASTTATGDLDTKDSVLAAAGGNDSATVQGTISLKSSKIFSVTQSGTEEALGSNDNYFTTKAAALDTVSNVDLRTQAGADGAIAVLDGAIEKISSMRSDLGAIENRLEHTVSNLMNIGENTEAARSRIQDADFAAESAKLAKAQVLKQAGVGMLSQANAGAQLVLQLLQ